MNELIDLTKILKNCPEGTKLYSSVLGDVTFVRIDNNNIYPIIVNYKNSSIGSVTSDGRLIVECDGECTLFPSKEQRDWNKFIAPWYKKDKFDPKTLKPFDKVLVRTVSLCWHAAIFSHIDENTNLFRCSLSAWDKCIPYNDDTKHLVGTKDEAPEYYKYWED